MANEFKYWVEFKGYDAEADIEDPEAGTVYKLYVLGVEPVFKPLESPVTYPDGSITACRIYNLFLNVVFYPFTVLEGEQDFSNYFKLIELLQRKVKTFHSTNLVRAIAGVNDDDEPVKLNMWDDPKYQDIVIEPSGNSENKSPAFEQGWEKITMEFVNKYPLQ